MPTTRKKKKFILEVEYMEHEANVWTAPFIKMCIDRECEVDWNSDYIDLTITELKEGDQELK